MTQDYSSDQKIIPETMPTTVNPDPISDTINKSLNIQELSIAITANNFNPTILNVDLLKLSGVIPPDWELARPPVLSDRLANIAFKNGINLVAQARTITISEPVADSTGLLAPDVARRYVETLPQADYQLLHIVPKSLVAFPNHVDGAREYIVETLLAPGAWRQVGHAPVQAALNLFYQLERGQLSLSIQEARLQQLDKASVPAVLFTGSFNYDLTSHAPLERLSNLVQLLANCLADLATFEDIVNKKFLRQQESVFPQQDAVFPSLIKS